MDSRRKSFGFSSGDSFCTWDGDNGMFCSAYVFERLG
jgi:hypothetical protein